MTHQKQPDNDPMSDVNVANKLVPNSDTKDDSVKVQPSEAGNSTDSTNLGKLLNKTISLNDKKYQILGATFTVCVLAVFDNVIIVEISISDEKIFSVGAKERERAGN